MGAAVVSLEQYVKEESRGLDPDRLRGVGWLKARWGDPSDRTIRRYIASGNLPAMKIGGRWHFRLQDVFRFEHGRMHQ